MNQLAGQEIIDTIFEFSNIAREIQNRIIIIKDIESNLDTFRNLPSSKKPLSVYLAYSKPAASVSQSLNIYLPLAETGVDVFLGFSTGHCWNRKVLGRRLVTDTALSCIHWV